MTTPIPPSPEPERVCANCRFYRLQNCFVFQWLPPCLATVSETKVRESDTCVLFHRREETKP